MMNEEDIVKRILDGDIDQYSCLISRYQVGLIIHCENILHDREDAKDIAQEAFIKAYSKLSNFDPRKARFSTWVYKIATNLALDHLRKYGRTTGIEDVEKIAEQTAPVELTDEERQTIQNAVHNLEPPKYGQIIRDFYWNGRSYKQIAADFNTTTNTIGTWMARAKAQLRKELS